jgi:hypothetical protein
MINRTTEKINIDIMENELSASDWELNEYAWDLRWWIDFFQISMFKDEPVPLPVLSFQKTRINTLGSYRLGRNDFGIKENININRHYLGLPTWEILSTLLHEMVHSYEYTYLPKDQRTNNWYHKKGFRDKLASFGILTNQKGQHLSYGDPFIHLITQHGLKIIDSTQNSEGLYIPPKRVKPKGRSKLKKWSCGCTNVRVAVKEFNAKCLECMNKFELII